MTGVSHVWSDGEIIEIPREMKKSRITGKVYYRNVYPLCSGINMNSWKPYHGQFDTPGSWSVRVKEHNDAHL